MWVIFNIYRVPLNCVFSDLNTDVQYIEQNTELKLIYVLKSQWGMKVGDYSIKGTIPTVL